MQTCWSRWTTMPISPRLRPRVRAEEVRVFYDVSSSTVEVLAIVPKPEAE